MLEVYWGSGSPFAWRVLLALEVKGIPYESKLLSFSEQEHKSAAYTAINPRAKIPAIKDGDVTLGESLAIMAYLDAKHPAPPLFGRSAQETGAIWRALMEAISYIELPASKFVLPVLNDSVQEHAADVRAAVGALETELQKIAGALELHDFLVGDSLSAADISLYPFVRFLGRIAHHPNAAPVAGTLNKINDVTPAVKAWSERIEALPGYARTYPPHWRTVA